MIQFGASILSWIPGWTEAGGLHAIQKTAAAGFDLLEISLPASLQLDAVTVKKQLANYGIEGRCSLILPKDCHMPAYPEKAYRLLLGALDKVAEMGGNFLGGVLYSAIGVFTGLPCTEVEKSRVCDVLRALAAYAAERNISLALEPINRYETYVLTNAAEVLDVIEKIGAGNVHLMLDTFHMNIEETGFYPPVFAAGSRLGYLHTTESDRGMLGEGNVRWDDLFQALADIRFSGCLTLENFSSELTELVGPTSLWRPSRYNCEELAKGSLRFMKSKAAQWGLPASRRAGILSRFN